MNYYIDFDNTLFDTPRLTKAMLNSIVFSVLEQKSDLEEEPLQNECTALFNHEHIYNIYDLAEYFADRYSLDVSPIIKNINVVIANGGQYLFLDAIPFLTRLKANGHKLHMLTFDGNNLQYQLSKITGTQIAAYFDALIITSIPKYELEMDFSHAVFIDDNPRDLRGLLDKGAGRIIRLRRPGNKYSVENIDNAKIEEYASLDDVKIEAAQE